MAVEEGTNAVEVQPSISMESKQFGPWSSFLVELQAFKKKFGHANPPEGRLFEWLEHQRALFEDGVHSEMHVSILRDLGCEGLGSEPCMLTEKKSDSPQDSEGAAPTTSHKKASTSPGSGAPASASATASSDHPARKGDTTAARTLPNETAPKGVTENKVVGANVSKPSESKAISQSRACSDTPTGHVEVSLSSRNQSGTRDGTRKVAESSNPKSGKCEVLQSDIAEDHKLEEIGISSSRESEASKTGTAGKHDAEKERTSSSIENGIAHEGNGRESSLIGKIRTVTPVTKNGQVTNRPAVPVNKVAVETTPVHEKVTSLPDTSEPMHGISEASPTKPTNRPIHHQQGCTGDFQKAQSNIGTIAQLNNNDVVCGGALSFGYNIVINFLPGNVQFRDMVQVQSKYASNEQDENMHTAEEIVMRIRGMNPPGRFVIGADGAWTEVEKKVSRLCQSNLLRSLEMPWFLSCASLGGHQLCSQGSL
jgi:hypothetical protein